MSTNKKVWDLEIESAYTARALREVAWERVKQDEKWGASADRPVPSLAVLVEEVGEVAEAMMDYSNAVRKIRYAGDMKQNLLDELAQVAAVAVAMIEGIYRGDVPNG